MASSSRPSTTRFSVFLSFRGEDTRHSFTDHLYAALNRAAIHTFRDNDAIKRGLDLGTEIVKAIESSRASVVVLSENYAKSRWCLQELSLILEQRRKKKGDHFVLPVFYKVDPSDVRNQRHNFAIEGTKWTEENVNRWKAALTEVANLTGLVASGSEAEFISNIVDTIDYELNLKPASTPVLITGMETHLTGIETRAKDINSWLKDEKSDTNVLAICGMGGSGKTTLAQYVYDINKYNFESSCFLDEIGTYFKHPYGLLELQKKLLTKILGGKNRMISCVAEGTTKINEVLRMKKVLIVLDDIDENDELAALLGTCVVNTLSKIIVTTRLLDIHSWFERISWRCHVHKLRLLNDHESLNVLSYYAFGSNLPLEGFSGLAVELAQHCGGNPLALKVLGSSLFVSAQNPQERDSIIEIWRSRLDSLSSLKGDIDCKIQGVLQKSFDSLPLAGYKELFLHIAAFFVGEEEDYVVKILEHDWPAKVGITTLVNRCLLTISPNKKLMMHQLLQDMGRNIIHAESKDPTKCTRVWCSNEAYRVFTKENDLQTIEGLALDTRKLKKGAKVLTIKTHSLAKMHKLKLLQLKYVKVSGHYKNFPDLRWLCWHGCHLRTIPSGLLMSNFLVAIDMTRGNLKIFEPPMVLNSLKILNLRSCVKLVSIHKLYRLPNLETLILWNCRHLTHVCKSIRGLESLALLNLAQCKRLWKSSWNKKYVNQDERLKVSCIGKGIPDQSFSLPRSLKFLFLDLCNLWHDNDLGLPFNGPLFGMSLGGNQFDSLPKNIDLRMLRVLNLTSCINLKSLKCLPSTLEELYTYGCKSLEKVTFQSARFRLRKFGYKGCLKLSEVEGLFKLVAVEDLDEADLGHMKWIKAYQDHSVDLAGDDITEGRSWRIQMLYEYGIRSTYLQGIKDQSLTTYEHTSTNQFLSFRVSLHPHKTRIEGLNVSCLYKSSSGSNEIDRWRLFTVIQNRTKGVTWIYNPLVYCKPRIDEGVTWMSYWPIGSMLDTGDEIYVCIMVEEGMRVSKCGVSLVYMDDEEINCENNTMELKEVVGGDLSEFELTRGVYYLCRRDFFKSSMPDVIKEWFGDTVSYAELQGWRKCHQSQNLDPSFMLLRHVPELNRDTLYKGIVIGNFNSKSNIHTIRNVVSRLLGVYSIRYSKGRKTLYVVGVVDSVAVETCVREYDKKAKILDVRYRPEGFLKQYNKKVLWRSADNSCIVWFRYSTKIKVY